MFNAIDLFSGCGGLSEGMVRAGFDVLVAVELNKDAICTYKLNHPDCQVINEDIRKIKTSTVRTLLNNRELHLLAGCPPCQGFSSLRRLNKKASVRDHRNSLLLEYVRFVKELSPSVIMLENVPGIVNYYQFSKVLRQLRKIGYHLNYKIINVKNYGVAQNRKRLVLVGTKTGEICVAEPTNERKTVHDAIGGLESTDRTNDPLHKITTKHSDRILRMIELIPKNGGSRKDLSEEFTLECHKKRNIGFDDVYGRLRWDDFSTTITGGCLNPSKGRFLHPEENRVISAREAALLQSFPETYKFPSQIAKTSLASLIGNAFPPKFSYIQSLLIKDHLASLLK
ncbi:MAG: DNA cytosine methyltransferase [Colwellia sp.]|nr:DNA cytosine methyltransferase [Colwellia sp.]